MLGSSVVRRGETLSAVKGSEYVSCKDGVVVQVWWSKIRRGSGRVEKISVAMKSIKSERSSASLAASVTESGMGVAGCFLALDRRVDLVGPGVEGGRARCWIRTAEMQSRNCS